VKQKDIKLKQVFLRLRALKRYARSLKYLAEDMLLPGNPVPDILIQQPPMDLEDELDELEHDEGNFD
jgi:hypothetical protein